MTSLRLGANVLHQPPRAEYLSFELRLHRKLLWCVLLSLVFHGGLMWLTPAPKVGATPAQAAASARPLTVRLDALPEAPVAPPTASVTPPTPARTAAPRVIASAVPVTESFVVPVQPEPLPAPPAPTPTPVPTPAPSVTPAPPPVDFATALAQRRAARGATADGSSTEASGAGDATGAAIARNLATLDPNYGNTGGVFQILHKGHRAAQFAFNGWKSSGGNKWRQVIDVDAGAGGDVERAIVQKMIALIREHYQGDFTWESNRLRRVVTLSAAPQNNEALEAFLLREFFG